MGSDIQDLPLNVMSRNNREHVPDLAALVEVRRKTVTPKQRERERVLANRAKAYGMTLSIGPGGMYCYRKENGREAKVWGQWAAKEFLRGVEFAMLSKRDTYEPGSWIDEELWNNEN